jgi:hypothetical protein
MDHSYYKLADRIRLSAKLPAISEFVAVSITTRTACTVTAVFLSIYFGIFAVSVLLALIVLPNLSKKNWLPIKRMITWSGSGIELTTIGSAKSMLMSSVF